MTGTDEHGLKIRKAAQTKGMESLAFCDELSEHSRVSFFLRSQVHVFLYVHAPKNLIRKADASATRFLRTSSKEHCDAVQHLWVGSILCIGPTE